LRARAILSERLPEGSLEGAQERVEVVRECRFESAKNGRIDDTKRLLKRGIKVDRMTEGFRVKGYTALSYVTFGGRNEIVKILLQSGADVDKPLSNRITSL